MSRIRLMIVDDHEVVRLGMRAAFELEPDIAVVGEASNGVEALAKMSVLVPQLILMDVRMEKMSGIETCRPHSAEGLTEKRISSKVRKKAEGPNRV